MKILEKLFSKFGQEMKNLKKKNEEIWRKIMGVEFIEEKKCLKSGKIRVLAK